MRNIDLHGRNFILSISGGNILTSLGGTEKVIVSHQKMFNENNIAYVYLYPVQKKIGKYYLYRYWGAVYDGKFMGLYTTDEIISSLNNNENKRCCIHKIHIHHLRGIKLTELSEILDFYGGTEIFFYLHDYYVICDNYALVRNGEAFCGIGKPCASKCAHCTYWALHRNSEERRAYIGRYLPRITFIAPSDYPREVVGKSVPEFSEKIKVIYHQKQVGQYTENKNLITPQDTVKVAFCGLPIPVKGWQEWSAVSKALHDKKVNIELYHLGKAGTGNTYCTNIPVGFQDANVTMTEALRKNRINSVVLWSQFPETYSYVYYECLAANCFVITYKNSGNIAMQVLKNKTGIVLNSRAELEQLLTHPKQLAEKINDFYNSDKCGPESLVENDEIVKLSAAGKSVLACKNTKVGGNFAERIVETAYKRHLKIK